MRKTIKRHKRTWSIILLAGWVLAAAGWFGQIYAAVAGGLLLINAYALYLTAWDKRAAKKGAVRIPESSLLGLAALGGSLGVLAGMLAFRHKTRHLSFLAGVPFFGLLQMALALWIYYQT